MTSQTLAEVIARTEGARDQLACAQALLKAAIDDPFHAGPCDEIAASATDVSEASGYVEHALKTLGELRARVGGDLKAGTGDGRPVILAISDDVPERAA